MKENHAVIVVAGYRDLEMAREDFHDLNETVKRRGVEIRSSTLVTKNAEGDPAVVQAANRHGRVGAGWGAGVGLLMGLFVPPLAGVALVGAAVGALVVSFAEHEIRVGLRHEIGQALEAGTAVVLTLVAPDGVVSVKQALGRASKVSVIGIDEATVNVLDRAAAEVSAQTADAEP